MSVEALRTYVVLYRDDSLKPADPPLGFVCFAEDTDHAEEQCENAYPGREIVWVWSHTPEELVWMALENYWGNT